MTEFNEGMALPEGFSVEQLEAIAKKVNQDYEAKYIKNFGESSGREIGVDLVYEILMTAQDKNILHRNKGRIMYEFPVDGGFSVGDDYIFIKNCQAMINTDKPLAVDAALAARGRPRGE